MLKLLTTAQDVNSVKKTASILGWNSQISKSKTMREVRFNDVEAEANVHAIEQMWTLIEITALSNTLPVTTEEVLNEIGNLISTSTGQLLLVTPLSNDDLKRELQRIADILSKYYRML